MYRHTAIVQFHSFLICDTLKTDILNLKQTGPGERINDSKT